MARVAALDIAKGIAIVSVVLSHSANLGVPLSFVDACFTFHMPLFFILSGYFTRTDVELDRAYVRKNVRALIYPYLATGVIVVALMALRSLLFEPAALLSNMTDFTVAVAYGAGANTANLPAGVTAIGAIWFLLAMFWAKLLLAAAHRSPYPAAFVLTMFALGYVSKGIWLPWSIQAGLCAVLFLYIGQLLRKADLFAPGKVHPLMWAVVAGMWAYCLFQTVGIRMVENVYPDGIVLDVLGGVCGTLCVVKLSQMLEAHVAPVARVFERLGAASLAIFCMHLVELDVFPWGAVVEILASFVPLPLWLWGVALRFALIAGLMGALYFMPRVLSGVFFPSRRLAR